ncbi:hypothetical protein HY213_01945, partial [Candidatus Peregrinibacteria bacterium]|nr:hypothetical protein [Candidatus Peregrinibacteria bacterium]
DLRLYDARDLSRPSTLVSVDPDGKRLLAWAGAISDDGRYVVFPATVPGSATRDIYLRDVQASKTILLTPHRHTTCAASSSPFKTVFRNPPQPVSFFDHLYQKKRPTSLFEVMKWHTADARNNAADAEPFEVRTSLSAAQIQAADASISFASTSFASPRDDVRNLDIHEQYGDPSNPNSYSIELRSFVRTRCDGAQLVRVVCDGDTDVPESRDRHPPLMNWKADMDTVIGALRQMKFTNERMHGGSNTSSNLIVSTVGRIRREYPALLADAALAALPPSQTIIVVLDAGRESRDEGLKQNYAILSADKAALIGNGTLSTSNRAQ